MTVNKGVDISARRCKRALKRSLILEIESIPTSRRKLLGMRDPLVYNPLPPITYWEEKVSDEHGMHWVNCDTGEIARTLPRGRRHRVAEKSSCSTTSDEEEEEEREENM